ncbi:N-acyl-D-amino-acid deacylase family protein [Homoserinibacter sp. YIM 151385]|uniref:N-acyl-D-amino-acid deacylase family protein n=1 Tax=Homoserinibacter sp. YIM 151385 TaxID=2985506 RepID=UPI0022F0F0A0|nr:D-aminoacylase [Homoserinibacter sp. YIM 151385]WBU37833.1 D-aminoacylase [Homoserinibacter sp. YIM 151385]
MARLVVRGGELVDGTGAPRRRGDLAVEGGRIAALGELPARDGDREIDARGLVIAPGFIDMHAHSDLELLRDREHLAKLAQGVTTQVLGQDGIGYAPVDDAALALVRRQISSWNGDLPAEAFRWRGMAGYLAELDHGIPTNAAVLVPQGNLRLLAIGSSARAATAAEVDAMRGMLDESLAAGAVGMSSGLTYTPGMYADEAELTALCEVVGRRGGYWAPHTRGYGRGALEAYAEAVRIARRAGCALHLTHATMNFAANRGRADALLELVDGALAEGVDVTLDTYPYLAGATTLAALLPSWAHEGGPDAALARLDDGAERARIREALDVTGSDGAHGETVDWTAMQISGVGDPALGDAVGATVAELAVRAGRPDDATGVALDLMRDDRLATGILMHVGDEDNVRAIMRHPAHSVGSDGILVGARPHPRGWGAFARVLAHYTRELGVLGLEEAVRHLAGTPARRLGLADRGVLREGAAADVVAFDPARVADRASYEDPRQPAEGMSWVLVNGEPAIADGARTAAVAGRVLRP